MSIVRSGLTVMSVLASAAVLAGVAPVLAQNAAAPPSAGGMTMDQFVAKQTVRIMAADSDGDGRVSRAEMAAMAGKGERDPSRRFDAMDTNHDGYLDQDEIRAALEKRFHRMDANGDGVLTPDERMAGRPQHRPPAPDGMTPASPPPS